MCLTLYMYGHCWGKKLGFVISWKYVRVRSMDLSLCVSVSVSLSLPLSVSFSLSLDLCVHRISVSWSLFPSLSIWMFVLIKHTLYTLFQNLSLHLCILPSRSLSQHISLCLQPSVFFTCHSITKCLSLSHSLSVCLSLPWISLLKLSFRQF